MDSCSKKYIKVFFIKSMFIDKHVGCVSVYFQYFDFLCTGWVVFFMIPKTGLFMLAYH